MAEIEILSGLGEKGPACMLLTINDRRWLLDCGHGPEANAHFDPAWLEGVDAVFITHDHIDHIGGAPYTVEKGLPIYTTQRTAMALPPAADIHILPEQGVTTIYGVNLTTGRNGHALGGVWFHFDVGDGLFYSGDWSEESRWFSFDEPPKARTAIIDCSYHLDDIPQALRISILNDLIDKLDGKILFPVPPSGRAGELAVHLTERYGLEAVMLDPECRAVISNSTKNEGVSPIASSIEPLLRRGDMEDARFLICDTPNADGGAAWGYVRAWHESNRLGKDVHVIFTGHMTAHARGIEKVGGGYFCRWNVHPPLSHQKNMIKKLGADRFAPVFCQNPQDYLKVNGFGAEVFLEGSVTL
ncbi:MAG TPA: MBL fold metallo-hydrolase [Rhizobiales bacterium]|nr:MBL fold metallo-hydrolase [Hyphomicrobiales bacterium]